MKFKYNQQHILKKKILSKRSDHHKLEISIKSLSNENLETVFMIIDMVSQFKQLRKTG